MWNLSKEDLILACVYFTVSQTGDNTEDYFSQEQIDRFNKYTEEVERIKDLEEGQMEEAGKEFEELLKNAVKNL